MALSSELREALASRQRFRSRRRAHQLPERSLSNNGAVPGEDSDDRVDPDDCVPQLSTEPAREKICTFPALPPPSPDWSHILGGRPHEPATAISARTALLAVGCRLSISPSPNALCEAARSHSVGAVRRLLVLAYGERGLSCAYQLAGREQPHKTADRANAVSANGARSAAPVDCSAIESGLVEAISQMPTKLQC